MAKGKNLNPADAFRMQVYLIYQKHFLNIVCRQGSAKERAKEGPRTVSLQLEIQFTDRSLFAVEQDREAKSARFRPREEGYMGYV
jgi:hypothetical protein